MITKVTFFKRLICLLGGLYLFSLMPSFGQTIPVPGDIIFNEYASDNNSTDNDYIELLVLAPALDLRGLRISDNELASANGTFNNGESVLVFGNDAYLGNVKKGTIILLWATTNVGVTTDTDPTDFKLVLANNTGFTASVDGLGGAVNTGLSTGGEALYMYLPGTDNLSTGTDNVYLDFISWEGDNAVAPTGLVDINFPSVGDNGSFKGITAAEADIATNWTIYDLPAAYVADAKATPGMANPGQNLDALLPNKVNLSVNATQGLEANSTNITVTVTANSTVTSDQTVAIAVTGTNITTGDYALSNTVVTIPNGQKAGTVTFKVRKDGEVEGTETATLTISNPSATIELGATVAQMITITDNTCDVLVRKSTATSTNGAEISAFDPISKRLYTVAGPVVEYYTLSNTGILSAPTALAFGFNGGAGNTVLPNSVAIRDGLVAIAYAIVNTASNAQQPGVVGFYKAEDGSFIASVNVGYLPDMITFTPDGSKILTANEGEPNSYGQANSFDPEGSISIISLSLVPFPSVSVQTASFTAFNSQLATLKAAGVRIYGPGATVAQDIEPEYITFSADGTKAFVTLQENNAIAEVNIANATVTQIIPLGLKDHNLAGNGLDASDADGASGSKKINIQNWPIKGMYQPDAIAKVTIGGQTYYLTANEGDSRAYTGFSEEIRVGSASYVLDPTVFPNATTLKLNANLGRLQLSNATGDTDNDTDFDEIHALGARSFTIWNSSFQKVFDSGDWLEQITAAETPTTFNSDGLAGSFDTRSDNKGPEPEAVTTGMVNGVNYAFVGLERTGDIVVFDITNPAAPIYKQYVDNAADLGVEGLLFLDAATSPTGKPLLIASAEVSKTVTVYEFTSNVADNLPTSNQSLSINVGGGASLAGNCSGTVLKLSPSGANQVNGTVNTKVWVENSQPSFNGIGYVKRHFEITPVNNAATATGRVTLYATQEEFTSYNATLANPALGLPINAADAENYKANLRVIKFSGVSSDGTGLPETYTLPGFEINPEDVDIIWNNTASRWEITFDVAGFSGFVIANANTAILPVNWVKVNGFVNGQQQPVIQWKVQESQVATFAVEKSTDGRNFVKVATVSSKGDGLNEYSFTDPSALIGTGFFRIQQSSKNGTNSYSAVVKLNAGKGRVNAFPNPVTDKVTLSISSDLLHSKAVLSDLQGRVIQNIKLNSQLVEVNMQDYPAGVYVITISNGIKLKLVKK